MPSVKGNAWIYCLNCTKFGQLLLRKITKIIATRSDVKAKNAPNSISAGAQPQTPLGGAYRAPPNSLAGFKEVT